MTANQTYDEEMAEFEKALDEKLPPERTSRRTAMEGYTEPPVVSVEPETGQWRSRPVRYYKGDWSAIQPLLPQFDLRPFAAGEREPSNPYCQMVMRRPMSPAERPMPVAVVSHSYSLVSHLDAAELCRKEVLDNTGCDPDELRCEVGLSELGEWMNFRIYLPDRYSFKDVLGDDLGLRLECFNSVDGWCRLRILFGWLRFVCCNGMVIGKTKLEIRERHGHNLDLRAVSHHLRKALKVVDEDKDKMATWQNTPVQIEDIETWSNGEITQRWGVKAAARVFHICESGKDIKIDPFAPGSATEKAVEYLQCVPGSPVPARTKYDVAQALSFVATRRNDPEERVKWQSAIPSLLNHLSPSL